MRKQSRATSTRKAKPEAVPVPEDFKAPEDPSRVYALNKGMFLNVDSGRFGGLILAEWMSNGHYAIKVEAFNYIDRTALASDTTVAKRFKVETINRGTDKSKPELPDFSRILGNAYEAAKRLPYHVTPWVMKKYFQEGRKRSLMEYVLLLGEDGTRGYIQRAYVEAFGLEVGMVLYASPPMHSTSGLQFFDSRNLETVSLVLMGCAVEDRNEILAISAPGAASVAPEVLPEPVASPEPVAVEAEAVPEEIPEVPDQPFHPFGDDELPEALPDPLPFPVPAHAPTAPPAACHSDVEQWARTADLGERDVTVAKAGTVWVTFPSKPVQEIRQAMMDMGFSYSGKRRSWYFRHQAEALAIAV